MMKKLSISVLAVFALFSTAHAQPLLTDVPLLGAAYPSGNIYLLVPDGATVWPDRVALSGVELPLGASGLLDRVLRDVHAPSLEDTPASRGQCRAGTIAVDAAPEDAVFDRGTPDNCETDPRLGLYAMPVAPPLDGASALVLGWSTDFTAPPDMTHAGQARTMSEAERIDAEAARAAFRSEYKAAYGEDFNPETSTIGAIPTLADATIISEYYAEGAILRLSQWQRITPAQHIYQHYIIDVIQQGAVVNTFVFSRPQGNLG